MVGFLCFLAMEKKLSLRELLPFSSIWFGTSCVSGTIVVYLFCWSLLSVSLSSYFLISTVSNLCSCLCLYGLVLPKNGCFFFLFNFEASASVGHSFLSFLMDLFVESLCELCWLVLLLRERLSLFFFFLC